MVKPTKAKTSAKAAAFSDVSPAWKVLQMKLNEEKSVKMQKWEEDMQQRLSKKTPAQIEKTRRKAARRHRKQEREAKKASAELEAAELTGESSESRRDALSIVAIDCEYVGIGDEGLDNALARVSIVDRDGEIVLDKYVRPKDVITDYRTHVSGIRRGQLDNGEEFEKVQREVAKIIRNRLVVGHALHNDFKVLRLFHPRRQTRDTAKYTALREVAKSRSPSLKQLAKLVLGIDIQSGSHDSVVDARTSLRIYHQYRKQWEASEKRLAGQTKKPP